MREHQEQHDQCHTQQHVNAGEHKETHRHPLRRVDGVLRAHQAVDHPGLPALLRHRPPEFHGKKGARPSDSGAPQQPLFFRDHALAPQVEQPEQRPHEQHEEGAGHHAVEREMHEGRQGGPLVRRERIEAARERVQVEVGNEALAVWYLDGVVDLARLFIDEAPDVQW